MDTDALTSQSPLSAEHVRTLAAASVRAGKVRRAAAVASFSGWSMAVFALITFAGVLLGSVSAAVLGGAFGVVAWNELRGAARLRRFDASGARILGWNQLGLAALICSYSAWSLGVALRSAPLAAVGGSTGDPKLDAMVAELSTVIAVAVYATLAVLGVVIPGLTAWYYFSRARFVRAFAAQTPEWAVQTLRCAA